MLQEEDQGDQSHTQQPQDETVTADVETVSKEHAVAEVIVESDQQEQTVAEKGRKSSKEDGDEGKAVEQTEQEAMGEYKEETGKDTGREDEEETRGKAKGTTQEESTTATSDTQDTEPQANLESVQPDSRDATKTRESQKGTSSKERRRDKKRRKSKGIPKLRKRPSQVEKSAIQYMHAILYSYFQPLDTTGSGLVPAETFWDVSPQIFYH